jgi:hypothetical protein
MEQITQNQQLQRRISTERDQELEPDQIVTIRRQGHLMPPGMSTGLEKNGNLEQSGENHLRRNHPRCAVVDRKLFGLGRIS